MSNLRLPAATATVALLCTPVCSHAIISSRPAFIKHAPSNPYRSSTTVSRAGTLEQRACVHGNSSRAPPQVLSHASRQRPHSLWFLQQGGRRRSRAALTSVTMAKSPQSSSLFSGLWAKPPLAEVSVLQLPRVKATDVAVVWFTPCDLRTHDHDGLVAAAGAAGVVPVFVFDDQELAADSRLDASFTFHAVQDLRNTLRGIGSDLVVRCGDAAEEVANVMQEAGASHVFFHASPVHALRQSHERVRNALAAASVDVRSWSAAQLTGVEGNNPSKAWNYRDFEQDSLGEPARSALPAPVSLPPLPGTVEPGPFPALEAVLSRVGSPDERVRGALSTASLEEAPFGSLRLCGEGYGESRALQILDDYLSMDEVEFARSVFGSEEGAEPEETGLEAASTRRIVKARGYRGLAPGEALARALGVALALGCISPRRMFLARQPGYESSSTSATEQGEDSPWSFLRPRVPGKCWARELAVIESWHSLLAERDVTVGNNQGEPMEQRYLRWHGWLVRYGIGGSQDPSSPAVLLVHGFGASCDQWDQVFHNFAPFSTVGTPGGAVGGSGEEVVGEGSGGSGGVRLMALDLLGFGHSAKPPLSFSQYSWADCARDVALRAGGGAFYIAGNSIGGYISMGVAADCKDLCQGVVLVNSAGRVLTEDEFRTEATSKYDGLSVEQATRGGKLGAYSAPPNTALAVLGTGLFAFLQGRIAETCRNVYPVNPGIVDEGLAEDILRDSCDPGAIGVIAAGGKLPFSRSANEMLGKFGGPVLVTQGVKDPLNDAEGRATLFQELGPQVEVVRVDGGHCPHHEVAEEVCDAVAGFVQRVEKQQPLLPRAA